MQVFAGKKSKYVRYTLQGYALSLMKNIGQNSVHFFEHFLEIQDSFNVMQYEKRLSPVFPIKKTGMLQNEEFRLLFSQNIFAMVEENFEI